MQIVLEALRRAAAEPAGMPLFAGRQTAGLFAPSPAVRHLAQRCLDEGLLRIVRREPNGRTVRDFCAITDKGLDHLLRHTSVRQVLEDLVRALENRQRQVADLVETARRWQSDLAELRGVVERLGQQSPEPGNNGKAGGMTDSWLAEVLAYLTGRQARGVPGDCPLPELYQAARSVSPALTVGQFHDGLRHLHERGQIYLHPWTGPLYELPEPGLALLVGHEIAYYASPR